MSGHVGVDWGSNGWVCARWSDAEGWDATVLPSFLDVWHTYKDAAQILVDIPIGMPKEGHRDCDREAKETLAHAPQRVFWTPPREALKYHSYEEAKENTDTSMTTQSWSILPRIRELDTFFAEFPDAHGQVREAHPEICFTELGGGKASSSSKQTEAGSGERLEILDSFSGYNAREAYEDLKQKHIENLPSWGRRFRTSNEDDLLDAMGLALMSAEADGNFETLPKNPTEDPHRGVPMEIVYYDPNAD